MSPKPTFAEAWARRFATLKHRDTPGGPAVSPAIRAALLKLFRERAKTCPACRGVGWDPESSMGTDCYDCAEWRAAIKELETPEAQP